MISVSNIEVSTTCKNWIITRFHTFKISIDIMPSIYGYFIFKLCLLYFQINAANAGMSCIDILDHLVVTRNIFWCDEIIIACLLTYSNIECTEGVSYYDLDYCDHNCALYDHKDTDDGVESCSHKKFQDLTPIQELEKFKNKTIPTCCKGHAYVFYDNCEVLNF